MMIDLKPCPFCGSEAKIHETGGLFTPCCTNPHCLCFFVNGLKFMNKDDCVNAWNTRAMRGAISNDEWLPLLDNLLADTLKVKALLEKEHNEPQSILQRTLSTFIANAPMRGIGEMTNE